MMPRCTCAAAFALLVTAGGAASAQVTSGSVQEGRDDYLKGKAVDVLKALMPGAELAFNISDFVLDPLVAAATTSGTYDAKLDAWLKALNQAGVSAYFPAYAIALSGGKIVVGGTIYTTEQMLAAAQDQQLQAILTGAGTGGLLDRVNNVTADTPFVQNAYVRNKGINTDNLGQKVGSEAELRSLWYGTYGTELRDLYGRGNATEVLDLGWPKVLALWRAQFAQQKLLLVVAQLDRAAIEVQRRIDRQTAETAYAPQAVAAAAAAGTLVDIYSNGTGNTITVVRGPGGITATEEWATNGRTGTTRWSNCVISTVLICNWTGDYRGDPDKTALRSGMLTAWLEGDVLKGTYLENEPVFQWRVAPYASAMHAGAQWPFSLKKVGSR